MQELKFHSIKAENILCFGPLGIEIDFSKYGQVSQLKGINMDAPGTPSDPASNGTGKSSIQELISIALFGKTVKSPTKNKSARILNVMSDVGKVELEWNDYKVSRVFKRSKTGSVSSKIDIWEDSTRTFDDSSKITFGTSDATQKFIETKIGLTHHAFCNVVIFDDSNTYSFLEADGPTKRQIVENLLDLDQYREYHVKCKELVKSVKKEIESLSNGYDSLKSLEISKMKSIEDIKLQEAKWKNEIKIKLVSLVNDLKSKQEHLKNIDESGLLAAWEEAQNKIVENNDSINNQENRIVELESLIADEKIKFEKEKAIKDDLLKSIQMEEVKISGIEIDIKKAQKLIASLSNWQEGADCPVCYGKIKKENYQSVLDHSIKESEQYVKTLEQCVKNVSEFKASAKNHISNMEIIQKTHQKYDMELKSCRARIKSLKDEISSLNNIPKPETGSTEKILEIQMNELKNQILQKKKEFESPSPFVEILNNANDELESIKANVELKSIELSNKQEELPYFEFWLEAFGDDGIRKFVIDNIIP